MCLLCSNVSEKLRQFKNVSEKLRQFIFIVTANNLGMKGLNGIFDDNFFYCSNVCMQKMGWFCATLGNILTI